MTFSSFYVIFFFYLFGLLKKGRCNDIDKILDLLPVSGPMSYVTIAMVTCHAFGFWAVEFCLVQVKVLSKLKSVSGLFSVCLPTDNDTDI